MMSLLNILCRLCLTWLPLLVWALPVHADTDDFTTPGTYNFTVPAGVTQITVEVWGGGGRGGSVSRGAFGAGVSGGGGGGGAYARSVINVVPGEVYEVQVGAGSNSTAGGGSSWLRKDGTYLVRATGGSSVGENNTTGGNGGAVGAAASFGQVVYAGGNGASAPSADQGGGGGGSAGTAAAGNNGSGRNGGGAVAGGGAGGSGSGGNGAGAAGGVPGGGGGGANCRFFSFCFGESGGSGGRGQVRITYEVTVTCFSDSFNRASLDADWATSVTSGSFQPQIVSNRLRMTQAVNNQATAATLQRLIPGENNYVVLEFDYYAYGGSSADGVAIVLSDAAVTPSPGSFGGALGYAQRDNGNAGFAGGWLGIGLDEYGNFPVAAEGRQGGVGSRVVDNVSLRGSGSGTSGYRYIVHTSSLSPGVDATGSSSPHRYRIELNSLVAGQAILRIQRNTGSGWVELVAPRNLLAEAGQAAVPENFFLSITGSTGSLNNVHEFDNLSLCAQQLLDIDDFVDHFELVHPGTGITCQPTAVEVRACLNPACTDLYTDPVTVTLTPGGWVGGNTISFSGGSTTAYFQRTTTALPYPVLGVASSTPITRPFTQTLCRNAGSAPAANQCQLTMVDAGLIVTVPDLIASKPDTTAQLQAVRTDNNTLACVPAFENVTRPVRFWTDYVDPGAAGRPASLAVQVNGQAVATSAAAAATQANIAFGAGGVANMTVRYADAGRLQLNARYEGSAGTSDSGLVLTGAGQFVSRPVGLCVQTGGECASADASCPAFRRAGEDFPLTLRAVGWESDADTDLCSGNVATPNFALTNIGLAGELVAPLGGDGGSVTPISYNHIAAASGETQVNLSESEVGVFRFRATPGNYLGGAMGGGVSAPTGRFYPASFDIAIDAGSLDAGCSTGTPFTYTGQPLPWSVPAELQIEARNLAGGVTANYTATGFRNLLASNVVRAYPSADDTAVGTDGQPLAVTVTAVDGVLDVVSPGTLRYTFSSDERFSVDKTALARVAPFTPSLSFTISAVTDSDGVSAPLAPVTFQPVSSGEIRYGRLVLDNVYGPETLPSLSMPLRLEYWQGNRFVINSADSCWNWSSADAGSTAAHHSISAATGVALGGSAGPLTLIPTGSTGTDQLDWAAPLWLQDFWQSAATLQNPSALATFGVFRGHDRVIYWREAQ